MSQVEGHHVDAVETGQHLVDGLYPAADRKGERGGPTWLLRRSPRGSAAPARAAGAARSRRHVLRRAAAAAQIR
ncbi:hypothetical protein ACFWCB_10940 [Streptomyces sp. NPDC060048]|uniref:hypothetical protein n=1 Tax=unclassified Streptomyces TaxID=2593676 RepID=UPI003679CB4C